MLRASVWQPASIMFQVVNCGIWNQTSLLPKGEIMKMLLRSWSLQQILRKQDVWCLHQIFRKEEAWSQQQIRRKQNVWCVQQILRRHEAWSLQQTLMKQDRQCLWQILRKQDAWSLQQFFGSKWHDASSKFLGWRMHDPLRRSVPILLFCQLSLSPSGPRDIIVMHPERNGPKVWYPYILRSCGVHYRNISGQLNSRIHLGFTVLTTMVLFCCLAAGCRFGVLQQRGAISKLVQNSAVIQLLLLASSSSSSRSKSERERRET
jgi:hypothetical protein